MKHFLVWIEHLPAFTGKSVEAHQQYLMTLQESGVLIANGPFQDRTGGAYILKARSLEEAGRIAERDPMLVDGGSAYKIKEWNMHMNGANSFAYRSGRYDH